MSRNGKVVQGQHVQSDKLAVAKRLRREMTGPERTLWRLLRRNAVDGFHFRRQQVIEGYIVDFYCDVAKLAIELDGTVHRDQGEYDESRDSAISRRRVRVLRISNEVMLDSEVVVEYIREALCTSSKPNP
jgi:very-short-patch-repair endonuclease